MKRLLELGETEVWAHWTLIPAALFLTVTEGPRRLGLGLLALLLHETGHLLTARGLGHRVRSLELWPFGAALAMDLGTGSRGALPVALAGPLCNLAAAAMSLLLLRLLPPTEGVMEPFFLVNLSLAAVNLLPAEPLDGGRALSSLLSRSLGARRARRLTAWTGLLLGGALLSLGVYGALLGVGSETALLFAAFLLFSGVRTVRGADRALEDLLDRRWSLRAGRPVEVREAAMMADRTAGEALHALRRGRYTLLRVVDRGDRLLGTLDEGTLLDGVVTQGENVTLGELISLAGGS
jgi:stage IV sporulation protein FB